MTTMAWDLPPEAEHAAVQTARAMHRPHGPYDKADLEQEARLLAWQAVTDAQHRRNLTGYVRQRVRWRISDLYRNTAADTAHARPASTELRYELAVEQTPDPDDVFDMAISRLDADGVLDWIHVLTPQQRRVLILHDIAGFPMPEVAKRLGLTLGAAKACRHRAVEQLRRLAGD